MNLDLEYSVQNRDVDFETREAIFLYKNYLRGYKREIHKLADHPDYKRDDSYHSIPSKHHIMYKYKVDDQEHTELYSTDGNRAYEFLIELDKDQASYGIYYGCRGLVKGGCQKEQNEIFMKEWDEMKYEISEVLNNTFPDKDFTKRFRMTDNTNNKTYWPFWIMLYDDEDVVEVAALAVKLICNVYKRYLNGEKMSKVPQKPKTLTTKTSFTLRDYMNTLKVLKNKDRFELFLKNAVACGYLARDDRYEVCYRFVNVKNVTAAYLFEELSLELGESKPVSGDPAKELTSKDTKIPWSKYTPIFLTENSRSIETLKQSRNQADHYDKGYAESAKAIFNEIMNFNVECQK